MGAARRPAHPGVRGSGRVLRAADGQEPGPGAVAGGLGTVGRIIERVVADRLDDRRLDGLVQIGVDEISYRRGRRYLTNVADHGTGGIVWSAPGRSGDTLAEFFELLGDRRRSIRAVSIDMSEPYAGAIRTWLPDAEIAFDPFHVVALAGAAVDEVRIREWQTRGHSQTPGGMWIKHTRWALLKAPEKLTDRQRLALAGIQQTNQRLYRAYLLKEQQTLDRKAVHNCRPSHDE